MARLEAFPKQDRMAGIFGIYRDSPAIIHDDFDEMPDDIAEAFGMKR